MAAYHEVGLAFLLVQLAAAREFSRGYHSPTPVMQGLGLGLETGLARA